jgi:hypothetical protein
VARFIFKDATYDLVDADDLTFQEISDMEEHTGFDMLKGKVSYPGLIWISVRRKYPNTSWDDVKDEKLLKIEILEDEEERLPPTRNGAAGFNAEDAPTAVLAPTDTGSPG